MKLPEIPKFEPLTTPPKRVGTVADLYYETKQRRLAIDKVAAALKKQEGILKQFLIDEVPKSNATGVAGKVARAQIIGKTTPRVDDWDAFYKYLLKVKRPELLQKRVSVEAIVELWTDKKVVPGVIEFGYKDVSLTKI